MQLKDDERSSLKSKSCPVCNLIFHFSSSNCEFHLIFYWTPVNTFLSRWRLSECEARAALKLLRLQWSWDRNFNHLFPLSYCCCCCRCCRSRIWFNNNICPHPVDEANARAAFKLQFMCLRRLAGPNKLPGPHLTWVCAKLLAGNGSGRVWGWAQKLQSLANSMTKIKRSKRRATKSSTSLTAFSSSSASASSCRPFWHGQNEQLTWRQQLLDSCKLQVLIRN